MMKILSVKTLVVGLSLCFIQNVSAQSFAKTNMNLSAKLFPLLEQLGTDKQLNASLMTSPVMRGVTTRRSMRLKAALKDCKTPACMAEALLYRSGEIDSIGNVFTELYLKNEGWKKLGKALKEQGVYQGGAEENDSALLKTAWTNNATGLNQIIQVYLRGKAPRYAKIDSNSINANDVVIGARFSDSLAKWVREEKQLPFQGLMRQAALFALEVNGRDEAARFVPLQSGLNASPYQKVKSTDFSRFPYSVILVPGFGPEEDGVALDEKAKARCVAAVDRYQKGLAPFIVVSGGNVHPFKTKFNEAVEMKDYLVQSLGVDESVVFIEPDARHTTTNLRNTSRMVYRFGLPAAKPILIVTDKSQTDYMIKRMSATALRDLSYLPYKNLKRLSEQESEFFPVWESLQVDPLDPLDP